MRTKAAKKKAARVLVQAAAGAAVLALTVWTAIIAKEAGVPPPLASVTTTSGASLSAASFLPPSIVVPTARSIGAPAHIEVVSSDDAPKYLTSSRPEPIETEARDASESSDSKLDDATRHHASDAKTRWFCGRPVRPARTIMMKVTAYSPDARSCGDSADGITATLHSVETNGFRLVAADPKVLKMGAMLTVPGYDVCPTSGESRIVPVLDVGGKIKGNRLDVLFETHEAALAWGVRDIPVVVWEYADGLPVPDPRKVR